MERITFQKILDAIGIENITEINTNLNIWMILINLGVAFILSLFIYFIYKKTFSGVLYSKNFNITLILVSLVTTSVVIVISSNIILALGMVGALSIVRFRMAVKDPKDVGFLFWAITNGIICGIAAYNLALISALFIGLIVFIMSKRIRFQEPYLLIVNASNIEIKELEKIVNKHSITSRLRSKVFEDEKDQVILELKIKKDKISDLLSDIKKIKNISNARLVSYEGDLEEA